MKRDFLRCLAGAAAGVLVTGTTAFAADLGVAPPPPPPPPVFTWTGFELGVQVGGGAGRTSVNVDGAAPVFPAFTSSASYGSSGVFGGVHVGFNYQFASPLVVGAQLEYSFAGITGNASDPPLNYLDDLDPPIRIGRRPHRLRLQPLCSSMRLAALPMPTSATKYN